MSSVKRCRYNVLILWTQAPGLFWKKAVHWSMYLWKYSSHIWHTVGKEKLCSLSSRRMLSLLENGELLHNRVRAMSSLLPFKFFSRRLLCTWLKKNMFCHSHYEQETTCFQFREAVAECRYEEQGPNRAIVMVPMTPWVFKREIPLEVPLELSLKCPIWPQSLHSCFLLWHNSWPWLGVWDTTGMTIEMNILKLSLLRWL